MTVTVSPARSRQRSQTLPAAPRRGSWVGMAALVAVVAPAAIEVLAILVGGHGVTLYGDQALIAIASQRAAHFQQLLGPYSRTGFHHPGPIVFYLLAPFVALAPSVSAGLYVGAAAINLAALAGTVGVVWRRAGAPAALWTAAALDLFTACLGPGTLREPWNPYLVIMPMVLFLVLWAVACSGGAGYGVWALVIGSYEVQTHIATAPVIASLVLVMAVRRRAQRPSASAGWVHRRRVGPGVLVVLWLAPLLELLRDRPNNLSLAWAFLTSSHRLAGWGQAARTAASVLTVVPFGNRDYSLALPRNTPEMVLGLLAIAAVAAWSWRSARRGARRGGSDLAARLIEGGVMAGGVGVVSLAGSDGPVLLYFALWLAAIPVVLLIALGVASLPSSAGTGSVRRAVTGSVMSAAVALTGLSAALALGLPSVDHTVGSGPWPARDASTLQGRHRTAAVTAELGRAAISALPQGAHALRMTIGSPGVWPYAAGIVLQLEEHGFQVTVSPPSWELYFGPNPPSPPATAPQLRLGAVGASGTSGGAAASAGGVTLASADGVVLTFTR